VNSAEYQKALPSICRYKELADSDYYRDCQGGWQQVEGLSLSRKGLFAFCGEQATLLSSAALPNTGDQN
jgi:hypothetical protein